MISIYGLFTVLLTVSHVSQALNTPSSEVNHIHSSAAHYNRNYESSISTSIPPMDELNIPATIPNESVEERLRSWREAQRYKYEHQSPMEAANPRQEDGKLKLLASVSRGSIAIFFFVLMWRSVHHYEMADTSFQKNGVLRILMVTPPVVLFLGNMAGCVGSVMAPGPASKKRMKAILNLNKILELSLMSYNILRLVIFPNRYVLREIYVGRILSNFLFLIQCQLFTKVTWNVNTIKSDGFYGGDGDDYAYNPYDQSQVYPSSQEEYGYSNDNRYKGYSTEQDDTDWR